MHPKGGINIVRARQLAGGLLVRYLANNISRMMTLIGTPNSHKMIGMLRSSCG
jgi:hypothetical protein